MLIAWNLKLIIIGSALQQQSLSLFIYAAILFTLYQFGFFIHMSIKGAKTMFRITKELEQCLKEATLYACNYVAKSHKYRSQYLNEWKKLSGKDEKNRKRQEKIKQREEREKLRQQIRKQKSRHSDPDKRADQGSSRKRQKEGHRSRYEKLAVEASEKQKERQKRQRQKQREDQQEKQRVRERERENQRQRQKQKQKQKQVEKLKQRERVKQFQDEKNRNQEKYKQRKLRQKPVSQLQKQRQLDFDKDFDFKSVPKPLNSGISDQQKNSNEQSEKQIKPKQSVEWSKRIFDSIGSKDSRKYKILRLDEPASDFQDENAPLKVPSIKPRHPLTPYFLFLRKTKCIISKKYPVLDQHGTVKNIWQNMEEQQKTPYTQEYDRAMRIYEKKLSQYKAVHIQEQAEDKGEKLDKKMKKPRNTEVESGKRRREYQEEPSRPRKKKGGLEDLDDYQL